jgi:hypothetical protein
MNAHLAFTREFESLTVLVRYRGGKKNKMCEARKTEGVSGKNVLQIDKGIDYRLTGSRQPAAGYRLPI